MNPQEREQLNQFLNQLASAGIASKDPEAETLIKAAVAKQPDAAYLLIQRSMLLEQALNGTKAQIAQLQNQLQGNQSRGSFLGNNPWAQPQDNQPVPGVGNYQAPRAQAPSSFMNPMGTGSSLLGNIATTAAGVVAGSFLFQGIENMMGHHASSPWGAGQSGENFTEQTTINNYYESDKDSYASQASDNGFSNVSDDDYSMGGGDDSSWV